MHTEIALLVLEKLPFGCLVTKQRVTGRKDEYHEVDEFIVDVVLTTKTLLIGLLKDQEHSKRFGYQQNKYNRKLQKVEIATEENILLGRESIVRK
jgi:NADH-quinone oxidoreductase subunit G